MTYLYMVKKWVPACPSVLGCQLMRNLARPLSDGSCSQVKEGVAGAVTAATSWRVRFSM